MAKKILNIELGEHICKACVSRQKGKNFKILSSFLFETPEGAVQDGYVNDVDNIVTLLKEQLEANNLKRIKTVNFSLTSARVVSREVTLPPMKESRIKLAIEANAGDYFPVDINSYVISFFVLEQVTGENPGWRVQVVAAPRKLIECYVALAEALGMHINVVDYCGNSQYQFLRSLPAEDVVLYIDVNENNTFVNFISDDTLLLQRNIAAGAGEMVEELLDTMEEKSYVEALNKAADAEYVDNNMTEDLQSYSLSRALGAVTRSEDYFNSTYPGRMITRVVLMGTCCHVSGLKEAIQASMNVETVFLEDVEEVCSMTNFSENISDFINCIGMLVAPLELIPEDLLGQKKKKDKESGMALSVLLFLVCIGAGMFLCYTAYQEYNGALKEKADLERKQTDLAYVTDIYNTYLGYQQTVGNLDMVEESTNTSMADLRAFLEEMEEKMPENLLLNSLTAGDSSVILNITTYTLEEADAVLSQLRSFQSIETMIVSTITETVSEEGISLTVFSVNCMIKEPEALDASTEQ